ncbi:MAG TPA: hypothetical protein VNG12_17565 [Acidimicrobiales bacterium]|nr:hypothetical protein [Acidimicrobiales bacterium]
MEPLSWEPEDEDDYEVAKAELKSRFAAWADDKGLEVERDGPEGLLHYKWAYVDRHITRWRRRDLYEIYLEIYPAKVMAEADELDEILSETQIGFARDIDVPIYRSLASASTSSALSDSPVSSSLNRTRSDQTAP